MVNRQSSYRTMDDRPLKVLLVEDEPVSRHLLKVLLERSPLSISTIAIAERLNEAMQCLDENHYQLVLLDLNLPDSRGVATLTTVVQAWPFGAVIVITGEYDESLAIDVLMHGAQDYLVKGQYTTEGLIKTIRYALARKQAANAMVIQIAGE